ncbi:hypothetical protein FA13DRAFT_1325227 [Coprinellus micaceus]|uniref:Uncharacterized protein n=1 Tax=Coprinellus micaceus TaxID=71717 RepID=A0A4Y7SRH5_COPMI|nr:hypothetical protein FA13DRAFT_1325227 [Coprinellus micaceus]
MKEALNAGARKVNALETVRLALPGLNACSIPDGLGDDQEVITTALTSLTLVSHVLLGVAQRPNNRQKAEIANAIIPLSGQICGWIRWNLTNAIQASFGAEEIREACINYTKALLLLADLHPSIVDSFLLTEDFLDIVFTVWTMADIESNDDPLFFMDCAGRGGDPILGLLRKIIAHPEPRDALLAYVEDRNIELFVVATVHRALRQNPAYNGFPPAVNLYARDLINFLAQMLESPSPRLRARLVKANYLTEFGLLLNDTSLAL